MSGIPIGQRFDAPAAAGATGEADATGVTELPEDVYARIVQQVREIAAAVAPEKIVEQPIPFLPAASAPPVPLAPQSLAEAGVSLGQLADLALKLLYLQGVLTGYEVSQQLRLPFSVVAEALEFLKGERRLEVTSGQMVGPLSYRFVLTDSGRARAREAFAGCRYVGPAPVSLEHYARQCRQQAVRGVAITPEQLQAGLAHLVTGPELFHQLGPAICSGQSLFLYGPAGNGKTVIAKALGHLLHEQGGGIYVPYAASIDNQIMSIFDPTVHRTLDAENATPNTSPESANAPAVDLRWRLVRRPVIIAGGELSLDMLDLRHDGFSGFYTAPLHLKANGGVFVLDDFGRQLVPAPQLLNRWILPLEERTDYLTLATGKKFAVPFEQLTVFSTNLTPEDLLDAAFLRRLRHKIEVGAPSEQQYREVFRRGCQQRGMRYDDWLVTRLLSTHYSPQIPPKASDPRDLLDGIEAICRFKGETPHLSEELVREAFEQCLGGPRRETVTA